MNKREFCKWVLAQDLTTTQRTMASILYRETGFQAAEAFVKDVGDRIAPCGPIH